MRKYLIIFLYSLAPFGLRCDQFEISKLPLLPDLSQFTDETSQLEDEIHQVQQLISDAAKDGKGSISKRRLHSVKGESTAEVEAGNDAAEMFPPPPPLPVPNIMEVMSTVRPFVAAISSPFLLSSPSMLLLNSLHSRSVRVFVLCYLFIVFYGCNPYFFFFFFGFIFSFVINPELCSMSG
jgi:hypothetical protein